MYKWLNWAPPWKKNLSSMTTNNSAKELPSYFGMSPHQIIRQERLETYWSILGGCIEHRQGFVFQCEDEEEADELKKLTYSMVFRLYDQWTVRLDGLIIKANPP